MQKNTANTLALGALILALALFFSGGRATAAQYARTSASQMSDVIGFFCYIGVLGAAWLGVLDKRIVAIAFVLFGLYSFFDLDFIERNWVAFILALIAVLYFVLTRQERPDDPANRPGASK